MIAAVPVIAKLSRNIGEDEDDYFVGNDHNNKSISSVLYKSIGIGNVALADRKTDILIIMLDSVTSVLEKFVLNSNLFEMIGNICHNNESESVVYYSASNNAILVRVVNKVVVESLFSSWLKIVMSVTPKTVVVISSLNVSNYLVGTFDDNNGTIKKLMTSCVKDKSNDLYELVKDIDDLEIGNIIQGIPAIIINYCEMRSISCINILSITKASLSIGSMKCLEKVIPLLSHVLSIQQQQQPANSDYQEIVKRDPFAIRTENLYC